MAYSQNYLLFGFKWATQLIYIELECFTALVKAICATHLIVSLSADDTRYSYKWTDLRYRLHFESPDFF